jgi:hypothetical protein
MSEKTGKKLPKRAQKKIEKLVLDQRKKRRVVILDYTGFTSYNLEAFVQQPTEGLLYDLNRLPETVLTFIDDPKWVNDFAVYMVITQLKTELAAAEARIAELEGGLRFIQNEEAAKNHHPDCGYVEDYICDCGVADVEVVISTLLNQEVEE